jgi:hypothetical protein
MLVERSVQQAGGVEWISSEQQSEDETERRIYQPEINTTRRMAR